MAMDKVIMGKGSLITAITKEGSSTTMVTITISFTPITINFTPTLYVNFVRKMGILLDNAIQPRGSCNNSQRFITPLLGTRRLQIGLWTLAPHHVTSNLTNLSHHQPYEGPDDILLGDGSSLEITHTGSQKGARLTQGRSKDDVYEWPWPNKGNTMGALNKPVHKLPFGVSSLQSRGPLDLVYSDVFNIKCPPYTPEHVGSAERKHRHVVETGLTMLHKAFLPLKYWSHAFLAAAYLLNRLPTPVLKHQTPFESLFQQLPNYDKLRAFGCLCFPWLRPYSDHKLDKRSKHCVFIGYSNTHNAYKCLDLSSNRVYISRHVQFIEHQFLLASNYFAYRS
ncbi:Retrovirus-related Pol polyprotein from transposon RE1 [Vitis vinifera]|uniref:Retrovirus-related Pol polyprotein from transposon RE1 n=1 Tax=Vitis vinifera TaxID=29760 RepID=A0A438J018_VITVI|nr:Retrovirus-related Pol polyprotein from transposon RE1 [Vitis vinifera]